MHTLRLYLVFKCTYHFSSNSYCLFPFSCRPFHWGNYSLARVTSLLLALLIILFIRIYLIGGGTPTFVDSDNPASFSPHFLTRVLTYSYLCAVNAWLLLCPSLLCHDWSMGSIPLIQSLWDPRNLATFFMAFIILVLTYAGKR